ncbi:uncharacterized protein LOC132745766 [Ruditapes philippinarum]|uniref:uncharacterized protein LOC132745766 n=1 Tax=Ruditapes philippinarum TaxID=129788 RepID=UPI00295B011B|nr:uncharacterized protein LOC132745766 [Ruditapes philippinarum]
MAEGINVQSFKDGSDADFEFTCSPCSKDNIREEANKYCPECQEYLCNTCTRYHGRLNATQQHKLLDKNDANRGLHIARTKCQYHADRNIEMSCDGVNKIEDASKQSVTQTEIQALLDETKVAHGTVKSLAVKRKQNLTALDKQKVLIEVKLDATETKLIEHIRKLKRETAKCLNDKYSTLKEELVSSISVSGRTAEDLKQTTEQLQMMDSMNLEQQFVRMKLMKKTVKDANTVCTEGAAEGTKFIDFTENKELKDVITKANSIGDLTTGILDEQIVKQRQYKIKSTKEINLKQTYDLWNCYISDICKLSDGRTIVIEYGHQLGLTMCCGDLWSSASNGVNVYSTSSNLVKYIAKDQNGKFIFKSSVTHMAATPDTVIVTDGSDGAVCLNKDGTVIEELRDSRLKCTKGVCVADDGTIFLCGYHSHNIVMFNRDGNCLGELTGKDSVLKAPVSMCFDGTNNRLIVGVYNNDKLFVIEFA